MNIGPVIRNFRRRKDLTLEALANAINISVSHLSLIERNKREPSLDCLTQIAKALKVPASVIIFMATDIEEGNEDSEIQRHLKSMAEDLLNDESPSPASS